VRTYSTSFCFSIDVMTEYSSKFIIIISVTRGRSLLRTFALGWRSIRTSGMDETLDSFVATRRRLCYFRSVLSSTGPTPHGRRNCSGSRQT
jgi:hypothetical protein